MHVQLTHFEKGQDPNQHYARKANVTLAQSFGALGYSFRTRQQYLFHI